MQINEKQNINNVKQLKPIKERQDIYVPNIIDKNISSRNGMCYVLTGSGGSGKSSLLLSMIKSKNYYKGVFDNIYYFCPESSMSSIINHPFKNHDKVYNDLTIENLEIIYKELSHVEIKKTKTGYNSDDDESDKESDKEIEYSIVIIDDFADRLKEIDVQKYLSKMLIKARHLKLSFVFLIQSYYYFPKLLRKQITYCSIFKPKNIEEWFSISKELLSLNKDDGLILYNYVYNEPYAHLDLDTVETKFYKNFNLLQFSK
jgi:energy-coupling factor transporter ATP-binding protein EcfA2